MQRILSIVLALLIGLVLSSASIVTAQSPTGGPMAAPQTPSGRDYNPDPRLGVQDHTHGRPIPPHREPPPIKLPAWANGATFSPALRAAPHSPSHGDRANPLGTGHRVGTPHDAAPTPPRRSEDDPLGSLRLLSVDAQVDGTQCVVGVIGGQADRSLFYLGTYGEGWFGCENTYWMYYTYQNLELWQCYASFVGWCLPGQAGYRSTFGACDQRFSEQVQFCGPFYEGTGGIPGTYYVRNNTFFMSATGPGEDYEDSGLFNVY